MKTKLTTFLLLAPILCSMGCAGLASTVKELKDDPAIVSAQITTIYGNLKFSRVGVVGTNETVTVGTDGTITIKNP